MYTEPTITLAEIAELLSVGDSQIVVLTHAKPDGDAFGSVLALVTTLRKIGRQATGVLVPPVPACLAALPGGDTLTVHREGMTLPDAERVVLVDTGAWSQVGALRGYVEARLDRTIIIDHHLSGNVDAAERHVVGDAAANCELIAELVELLLARDAAGGGPSGGGGRRTGDTAGYTPLDPVVRDALFVGIASDTGWFRFSNTRPETHELAAKLIRQGTDHAMLYQRLEQNDRPEKLALLTRALDGLEYMADGKAAVMTLTLADFRETGARPDETERVIDTPQVVGDTQVFVLLTEAAPDRQGGTPGTRMSFRSRHTGDDTAVDVAQLAQRFGGGGHARAAGAKSNKPLAEVKADLAEALETL